MQRATWLARATSRRRRGRYSRTSALREALGAASAETFGDIKPASTLLGVQALANPAYLIEIDGIAVVPD